MPKTAVINDVKSWIDENQKYFEPPICNKLMHRDGQLKVFFVGGPNKRKDFHIEEGEEFFYMLKGDMCLRVLEQGRFKDIIIKEGEVFLLPPRIPHSPQRQANTLGLVIERERLSHELDCLRYFVEDSTEILYERWFYCDDLGQLGPLIQEYFASEEYRTGKPLPGSVSENPPYAVDDRRKMLNPFSLDKWIKSHRSQIDSTGFAEVFDRKSEVWSTEVVMLGKGVHSRQYENAECFLWQWEGSSKVEVGGETNEELPEKNSMLVPLGERWTLENPAGSLTLLVVMNASSTSDNATNKSMVSRKESPER